MPRYAAGIDVGEDEVGAARLSDCAGRGEMRSTATMRTQRCVNAYGFNALLAHILGPLYA